MGIYIALIIISVIAIAVGMMLAKAKKSQLWYILSIIGTGLLTVAIVFTVNYAISANQTVASPALENTNWREQRTYSRNYQLNDDLSICISLLDDSSGYAVYDTYDGSRIGTLSWQNDQTSIGDWELKVADCDRDGNNEIGVITQTSDIIWYKFLPDSKYSKDNPNGCFEIME